MVIDDESDILSITKSILETCPFPCIVEGYSNPQTALASLAKSPAEYSLVLTDIRMPVLNGFLLAIELKKIRQDVPIIFMTAFDIDQRMPGYPPALKKESIVQKPNDILRLCGTVEQEILLATTGK